MTKRTTTILIIGACCTMIGVVIGVMAILTTIRPQQTLEIPLESQIERNTSFVILATTEALQKYAAAMTVAKEMHPGATTLVFSPGNLDTVKAKFVELQPKYALVFIMPTELDVNFAWRWLRMTTQIDDDPFVDVRTGFVTGDRPESTLAFMLRIKAASVGRLPLRSRAIDNLGPNTQAPHDAFFKRSGSFMVPVLAQRLTVETISHGTQGFTKAHHLSMDKAGIVHWGGHGYPDRVVDSLDAAGVRALKLAPHVAFNGACYTGVTSRWFDVTTGELREKTVLPSKSFCLGALSNQSVGYLAALHPDHGIPVYQEMEYLATHGASLGDIMKHTHDGVVVGNGGSLPVFETLVDGMRLRMEPKDVMLKGTASRVLFGDPSFVPLPAFTSKPFDVTTKTLGKNTLEVTATLVNPALVTTFADTFHSDMSATKQFNDRALVICELPKGWLAVETVQVIEVKAGGRTLEHKLIGFAVERDGGKTLLHFQVDMPSSGYMQSSFRRRGSSVRISAKR